MASNLVQRVGFAAGAIPVVLAVVWLGGWPLAALVAVVGVLGTREVLGFARLQGIGPVAAPAYLAAAGLPLLAGAALGSPSVGGWLAEWLPHLAAGWVVVVLTWVMAARRSDQRPLTAAALTLLAPVYTAALPAFLLGIRHAGHGERSWAGTVLVFFPLVVTWVCDSAAMFVGKAVGGPKLAPVISPGKTRSGGIGGLAGAVGAAVLWDQLVLAPHGVGIGPARALVFGAVLGVVGQVGDLVESHFKREVGLKDSSALIPGHGGALDRFDSLYFVLPVAAALLRWFSPS